MKKWITAIVCIIIITAFGLLVYFNIDAIKSNSTLYTKEQMDEAYQTGYNDGLTNEQDYIYQINELLTKIKELEADIDLYKPLAEENPELKNQIIILQSNIKELEERISLLEAELEYYKDLENENLIFIKFFVDDEIYRTIALNSGETITDDVTNPIKENYIFNGWKTKNNEIIDIYKTTFNENTEIFAEFKKFADGVYKFYMYPGFDGGGYYFQISKGQIISFKKMSSYTNETFSKIYFEESQIVDCLPESYIKTDGYNYEVKIYSNWTEYGYTIYKFHYDLDKETCIFDYYESSFSDYDDGIKNTICERK